MIGTARNFTNKPVFLACDGVQIRQREAVRQAQNRTAERHEIAGTPRASERKFYRRQHEGRRACLMIDGKRGTGEGGEAARRGGGYRGKREGRSRSERKEGTTRRKSSACRIGVGAAPHACVYIAAIYSIFIYIYYLYIYNIYIISIYLIVYINIIPFSPFSCNTSVLYVKNSTCRAYK